MLNIFGQVLGRLGPTTATERELLRQEETIDLRLMSVGDIWTETEFFWRSSVGDRVGLVYLGWDLHQLRVSMPRLRSREGTCFLTT